MPNDDREPDDLAIEDDTVFTCWCGAKGTYDEMFAETDENCGGTGTLNCYCGGDFCVCHNHGEVECDGCEDCESQEPDDYEDYDDDE